MVKGPKGELTETIDRSMSIDLQDGVLSVKPKAEKRSAIWGLTRALVSNMVKGVTEGYEKILEIEGIGYRAQLAGDKLVLSLGFSHPVNFPIPSGITINVTGNVITVSGIDKQQVGQVAADIRAFKKPEPYKGKGIRYRGEHVRRKAGKKTAA